MYFAPATDVVRPATGLMTGRSMLLYHTFIIQGLSEERNG